ncbi:uncharacterized protein LOC111691272 isoform X1 [Anoplophora glabripennis]|uniref:uncharacterized protein LOC111691272 isoform X1 n=1 Tax=Anoplophora glabripennis TaxID=217634 RepID=UPI0008755D9E|nr:uncharacterized protein LOC111691272 isoform X1 [Anoplophora glabripennis]
MSDISDIELPSTPPHISEKAENAVQNILPQKSKKVYEKLYQRFMDWRNTNNISTFSENVLIAYFQELMETMKSSSTWTHYSIIKTLVNINHNINISKYKKLQALLKRKSEGYVGKKAKIYSPEQIKTFIDEAPDERFLFLKVAMIFGIMGACRRHELHDLKCENVKDMNGILIINVIETKTKVQRTFTITGKYYEISKKYLNLRPKICPTPSFFVN